MVKRRGNNEGSIYRRKDGYWLGKYGVETAISVGECLNRWLNDSVRGSVRASTYTSYEGQVRRYIIPAIGRIKLGKLTPAHI